MTLPDCKRALRSIVCRPSAHSVQLERAPHGAADQKLVVGYVFAIRSERLVCREVPVNLAYRWFCKLGIEDAVPDHSAFSRARNERFREGDVFRRMSEWVVEACIGAGLLASGWGRLCGRREPDPGRCQQAALDCRSGLAQGPRSQEVHCPRRSRVLTLTLAA
jgi:hypothetical protein